MKIKGSINKKTRERIAKAFALMLFTPISEKKLIKKLYEKTTTHTSLKRDVISKLKPFVKTFDIYTLSDAERMKLKRDIEELIKNSKLDGYEIADVFLKHDAQCNAKTIYKINSYSKFIKFINSWVGVAYRKFISEDILKKIPKGSKKLERKFYIVDRDKLFEFFRESTPWLKLSKINYYELKEKHISNLLIYVGNKFIKEFVNSDLNVKDFIKYCFNPDPRHFDCVYYNTIFWIIKKYKGKDKVRECFENYLKYNDNW